MPTATKEMPNFVILKQRVKVFKLAWGTCNEHLLTFDVPANAGVTEVKSHWDKLAAALGISSKGKQFLKCELSKMVAMKPNHPKVDSLFKGGNWELAGFATWKPLESDECTSGVPLVYDDTPDAVYTVPHQGTHPTMEDALATCMDTVCATAEIEGDTVEAVLWINYGEI